MIVAYQAASVKLALQNIDETLAEQGLPNDPVGAVNPQALLSSPTALAHMADSTSTPYALDRLAASMVQAAAITAAGVAMAARRDVTVYVRTVGGSACARCAILSGRVYRWSTSFDRHPNCRCDMIPTTMSEVASLGEPSPMDLFKDGRITDLSRADTQAINDGGDIFQVVNSHREAAGMSVQSSVIRGVKFNFTTEGTTVRGIYGGHVAQKAGAMERQNGYLRAKKSRLTPETIYRVAGSREHAIELLRHYGYILP